MAVQTVDDFFRQLRDVLTVTVSSSQKYARAVQKDLDTFLDRLRPEIAANVETAIRLNEKTHWDTLKIQASRVLQQTLRGLDAFASNQRTQIKATVVAFIQVLSTAAVAV